MFQRRLADGEWNISYNDYSTSEGDEESEIEDENNGYNVDMEDSDNDIDIDIGDNNIILLKPPVDIDDKNLEIMYKRIVKLQNEFDQYCKKIPVLGFNCSKYDFNLAKVKMIKYLKICNSNNFIIKRSNSYVCVETEKFRLLDIAQYLAQGTSYDHFLRSYHCDIRKGFFPYEFLDSVSKLNFPRLPNINSFYSKLKGVNVLEADKIAYEKMLANGFSSDEVKKKLGFKNVPFSKEQNYNFLQNIWKSEQMYTVEDLLRWYNKLDVQPFVIAVERLMEFYVAKGCDIFKQAISLPGISRFLFFKSSQEAGITFPLFGEKDKSLFWKVKNNIVGGPSIVFSRHAKVGKTKVRPNGEKIVQGIIGFDCTGLYLNCMKQALPSSYYVRRSLEDGFCAKFSQRHVQMFEWLDFLMFKNSDLNIIHLLNSGKEVNIGTYRVDGFDAKSNTIFEYAGCFQHGHFCIDSKSTATQKLCKERYDKTILREKF